MQTNVVLIVLFNYLYTFQQLDPKDLADQLKRQGSSVQGIRPGKQTSEFITETLKRMSLLGSGFLGLLAAAPAGVEALTKLQVLVTFARCRKQAAEGLIGQGDTCHEQHPEVKEVGI